MKLLLSAYDCDPVRGSEARLSWNYVKEFAALGHEIHVLTSTRSAEHLPAGLAELTARGANVDATMIGDHRLARRIPRLGWMGRYLLWQWHALDAARDIDAAFDADIVHHVGWGSLQGGSRLWQLGKPFLFGPVGGAQHAPAAFKEYFGSSWRREWLRTTISVRSTRFLPTIRGPFQHAEAILAANRETYDLARRIGAKRIELIRDVAIPPDLIVDSVQRRPDDKSLRIVWLARHMPRKGLALALDAFAKVAPDCPVQLTVVGADGTAPELVERSERIRSASDDANRLVFRGVLDWPAAQATLRDADVFLFTSLRDTTGVQLLEAIASGLAVITLDHHGGGEIVSDDIGITVPVIDPETTSSGIADAIERLANDRELTFQLRENARAKAPSFSWPKHAAFIDALYQDILSQQP
ncbi:MAG: glycosyltransferase family 4 protein [Acidimicrobiia bacterium]|nr:glycosyltransferase family 4 protein [Acidimicrobiia bacterium]